MRKFTVSSLEKTQFELWPLDKLEKERYIKDYVVEDEKDQQEPNRLEEGDRPDTGNNQDNEDVEARWNSILLQCRESGIDPWSSKDYVWEIIRESIASR